VLQQACREEGNAITPKKTPAALAVRLKPESHAKLQETARDENRPMGDIVADALQRNRLEQVWERARESVARLKADPVAWKGYQDEIAVWDSLAGDGLTGEEPYYTPEEEAEIEADYARTIGG
jgi:predicted transcriptional regulator